MHVMCDCTRFPSSLLTSDKSGDLLVKLSQSTYQNTKEVPSGSPLPDQDKEGETKLSDFVTISGGVNVICTYN